MKAEGSRLQKQVSTVTKCVLESKDRASTERKQKTAIQRQRATQRQAAQTNGEIDRPKGRA